MKVGLLFSIVLVHTFLARCGTAGSLATRDNARSLVSAWEKIAPVAKGRVGAAVMLLESGESAELSGDKHFVMQSVYKLPIAMAVLQRVDNGELQLEQMVEVEKKDFVPEGV